MTPQQRIESFTATLLLPLFEEICASPRLRGKGRAISIVSGAQTGDPVTDAAHALMHEGRWPVSHLSRVAPAEQRGEWVGHSLVIVEPSDKRAPYGNPQAGRFNLSALFRLPGDGRVLASPFVFYWMRFNDRMHGFAHRYDNDIADHPVEQVTRAQMVNHALGAITAFDLYAFSSEDPFAGKY